MATLLGCQLSRQPGCMSIPLNLLVICLKICMVIGFYVLHVELPMLDALTIGKWIYISQSSRDVQSSLHRVSSWQLQEFMGDCEVEYATMRLPRPSHLGPHAHKVLLFLHSQPNPFYPAQTCQRVAHVV